MRKLNKPLLRKVARKLRRLRHEEHYDQGAILDKTACGTAACVAGHTVLVAGYKIRPEKPEPCGRKGCGICADMIPDLVCRNPKTGRVVRSVLDEAQRSLGLSARQSEQLFSGSPASIWPQEFAARWSRSDADGPAPQRPSRIAADLLDAIADTNGKVLR